MEHPDNREDEVREAVIAEPIQQEVLEHIGVPCRWCKHVANHPVIRTYPNKMRVRKCVNPQCLRPFQTWEKVI